jgi:hypothetical protein
MHIKESRKNIMSIIGAINLRHELKRDMETEPELNK